MSKILKGKENCQDFLRIVGHFHLGRTKGNGSMSYACESFPRRSIFLEGIVFDENCVPCGRKASVRHKGYLPLFGRGFLSASSQHRSRALFISVNFSNRSGVTRTFSSLVSNLKNGVSFSDSLEM